MKFVGSGQSLGARVEDLDLSKPLSDEEFKQLEQALRKYGVLMRDNMGTLHNAVADYTPDEHRYIKRCQVIANRYFEKSPA